MARRTYKSIIGAIGYRYLMANMWEPGEMFGLLACDAISPGCCYQ